MLTIEEKSLVEELADIYNKFVTMPKMHPQERTEFCGGIHYLQNMIMARGTAREYPGLFKIMDRE